MNRKYLKSRSTMLALVALAAILGISTASMASGALSEDEAPESNGTPKSETLSIDNSTKYPESANEFALLVYKNKSGETCVATGEPSPDRTSVGRRFRSGFEARPLKESGICGLKPDPIAFAGEFGYDVGNGPMDQALSAVYGVATSQVDHVTLNDRGSSKELAETRPGKKGGFILAIPGVDAELELRAVLTDGSTVVKDLPKAPSPKVLPPDGGSGE
ncbi:MAG: hypothetical protein ACRDKE_06420 [Solirubrobacterales bacterium]